jgi:hypothetical protein
MARAVASQENGEWIVLVDVDNYGGEEMSIHFAKQFKRQLEDAISDAERGQAENDPRSA